MKVTTAAHITRELDRRASDNVEVALLWYPSSDVVSVTVVDSTNGDGFELILGDGDGALDVFQHPYAYAAHRGVQFQLPSSRPALAAAA